MAHISLRLLGGFEARAHDGTPLSLPTQKYKAMLAFLALPPGQAHPRDKLVALLWDELPHEQGRAALRQAIWALRRAVNTAGAPGLLLEGDTIALNPDVVRVDAGEFESAAQAADPGGLAQAAALYRGPLLAGISAREGPFEEWLAVHRERLAEVALQVLARLLGHQRRASADESAVQTAMRLLALDPLQEPVHRALMQLYLQLGRRGAALRQYQTCVEILQRELRAEPEPETRALYQKILRHRASREAPAAAPPSPVAASPGRAAVAEPSSGEPPLIGRDLELTLLREALDQVAAGRGQVVTVIGEAGIGKSRLVTELGAEALARGGRLVLGRAHDSDRVLPFGPWADALGRAGLTEALTTSDGTDTRRLFERVAEAVSELAAAAPVVLVLEDLHWADEMSLRLVAFLARRIHERLPVLVVLTAREEEMDDAPLLRRTIEDLDRELTVLHLALPPLSREDTVRLADALAGRRGGWLGEGVWKQSEGHPFMIVEMIRALGEEAGSEGPADLGLPQRMRRLIERRLDRLGQGSKALVAAAAVIGRDFDFALLQRAAGIDEEAAVAGLEELVRRRLVQATEDHFEFAHDRLRDVAAAGLLPPRRKLLHRRVAEAMEALGMDDRPAKLAALGSHYAEAEVWDRAARFLHRAGHAAWERSAYREATILLEQALAALARLAPDRATRELEIDIRLRLYRALFPLSVAGRMTSELDRAYQLASELGDEGRQAIALVYTCENLRSTMRYRMALDAGQRGLALATADGNLPLVDEAHFQLAAVQLCLGTHRDAIAHFETAVARRRGASLRERTGYPHVPALSRLARSLADLGDFAGARAHAGDGLAIGEAAEHLLSLADASAALGAVHAAQGAFADAIPPLERALELSRAWEIRHITALTAGTLAIAHVRCGAPDRARAILEARDRERPWETTRIQPARLIAIEAEGRRLLGDAELAGRLAREGLDLGRAIGDAVGEAQALLVLGELDGTDDAVREAFRLAESLTLRPLQAHCRMALGRWLARGGRHGEARRELDAALAAYRTMDMSFWAACAEDDLRRLS